LSFQNFEVRFWAYGLMIAEIKKEEETMVKAVSFNLFLENNSYVIL